MILKILTGMQAGVEVALAESTYVVGSGMDDDIQFVDVSLLAGHFRLRVAGGKAEVAAQAGQVQLGAGATLTPDQGWRGLEPLEAATAGTTRFALGPRSANWASVAEDGQRGASVAPAAAEPGLTPSPIPPGRLRALAVPLLGLLVVALLGGWYALTGGHLPSARANHADDLRTVRAALDAFPFGAPIETRQEVDGAIYVSGYVETPVERRALAGAVDRTGMPVHLRLFVLDDIRREITALIAAEKLSVTSTVSDKGAVTLDGLVLQPAREHKLIAEIGETVLGVSGVTSHIHTAETLIEAVRQLVADAQLKPWLLLRLDGDVIEVSGALPSDKVDAWVGFLQTYASRFAEQIALRSFVQLQAPNGRLTPAPGTAGALAVGPSPAVPGDTAVDVERLRRGDFSLGDIFVGESGSGSQRDRASNVSPPATRVAADAGRRDRAPAPAPAPGSSGTAAALATLSPMRGGTVPDAPGSGRPDLPARAASGGAAAGAPDAGGRTAQRAPTGAHLRDGTLPGSPGPGRPGDGDVLAGPSHADAAGSDAESRTTASGRTGAASIASRSLRPDAEASLARGASLADASHGGRADSPVDASSRRGADPRQAPGVVGSGTPGSLLSSVAASAPGLAGRTASGDAISAPGLADRTASGDTASAPGLAGRMASGDTASAPGLAGRTASGDAISAPGLADRTASGDTASAPGLAGRTASGDTASAPGLAGRTASGDAASAPGLAGRTASGDAISAPGLADRTASGDAISAPGLAGRTASGDAVSAPGLVGRMASGDTASAPGLAGRTASGQVAGGDVAADPSPAGAAADSASSAPGRVSPASARDADVPDPGIPRTGTAGDAAAPGEVAPGVVRTAPEQLAAGQDVGAGRAVGDLAERAARALKRFRDGKPGQDDADRAIDQAVALLESRGNGATSPGAGQPPAADWYLPLFVDPRAPRPGTAPCWAGTSLTADDLLPVLFWLDVMSASRRVTLAAFDQAQQSLLIEAALNPREVAACARRSPAADHSLYLREVSRNPGFVAFVLRDLPAAELDIAGASLGRRRFVITGAGDRMAEGAAPDRSSRLAVVGELGLALQREDGLSVMVFGPGISWTVAE